MSRLANLPTADDLSVTRTRRGPSGACDVYGDGDIDDWRRVERLRLDTCWSDAQKAVDDLLGVDPINIDKFRYHWRRRCWHWTEEQKRADLNGAS